MIIDHGDDPFALALDIGHPLVIRDVGTDCIANAFRAYSFGATGWTSVTGDLNHDGRRKTGVTNGQP
jgi:hypothetical protein